MKNTWNAIKGLIFDYGGTLDTPGRHWAHVLWEGYRQAAVPLPEADFREAYVHGERTLAVQPIVQPEDTFRDVLLHKVEIEMAYLCEHGKWVCSDRQRDAAVNAVVAYCDSYARKNVERSGAILQRLAEKYPIVLVTNFYGNMSSVLAEYGVAALFRQIVESVRVGVRKPSPDIYRLGVEALSLPPNQILVVGDSYDKDIVPASSLGCHTAWLKGEGWTPHAADDALTDVVLTDLEELLQLLKT